MSRTQENVLDNYILSKLALAIQKIEQSLDSFDSQTAYAEISSFFEVLNNWYIRRSRNRFWKTEKDADKTAAYNTLFTCLDYMSRAMSSLLPLVSEAIYLGLNDNKGSVHLSPFPNVSAIKVDHDLVQTMDKVLEICNAGLFIRSTENIRVRQPLRDLKLVMHGSSAIKAFEDLIIDELNVKSVVYLEEVTTYADYKLSINFPVLGKRLPAKMKDVIAASKQGAWSTISLGLDPRVSCNEELPRPSHQVRGKLEQVIKIAGETLLPEEFTLNLIPKTAKGTKALSGNDGVVMLNLEIDRELELEGLARDIIRAVQQARKDAGFYISDRILLECTSSSDTTEALKVHANMIMEQTLSELGENIDASYTTEIEIGDSEIILKISKK